METPLLGRAVIFGEILFDSFPDGKVVMGGAPLNVAWHLQGFGLDPLLISRLGMDERAETVITAIKEWGMDASGIQRDVHYPTGQVQISLNNGQPSFSILPDQAYDYINTSEVESALLTQKIALLYHGSLAARNKVSMQALKFLRHRYSNQIFLDINLREPWWQHEAIDDLLAGVRWLKLNDNELFELSGNKKHNIECLAVDYAKKNQLGQLIITLGDKGAFIVEAGNTVNGEPVIVDDVVDTVGAGDAFSSIMILAALHGWSMANAMPRALEFAAMICSIRGATITDRSIYNNFLEKWGEE